MSDTFESKDIKADRGGVAANVITDSVINIINGNGVHLSKAEAEQLERQYLRRMMQDCAGLEWLRLVRKQDEEADGFGLESVYTALQTTTSWGIRAKDAEIGLAAADGRLNEILERSEP